MNKYEIIILWSDEDESFVAEEDAEGLRDLREAKAEAYEESFFTLQHVREELEDLGLK